MNKKYMGGKEASELLGVHQRTLYQWEEKGWIETIRTDGGKRMYNVEKYMKEKECKEDKKCIKDVDELDKRKGKLKLCYVRVSSMGQKEDLERQKKLIREKYPNHTMIQDIGSGINLNKRGIQKIIDLGIEGKIEELVVAYKDRLARFGYELIERMINTYSNGEIKVENKKEEETPEEEISKDIIAIMNVYVSKINGLRKYKKEMKEEIEKYKKEKN